MDEYGNQTEPGSATRRATLATGTAAVLAWSTPLVVSTPANAASACTPRCMPPPTLSTTFTLARWCQTPGGKWLYIYGEVAAGTCPCSFNGDSTPTVTVSATNWFDTNNSGGCTGGSALTVTNYPTGTTEPNTGQPLPPGFRLSTNGAIGSGCIYGCVRVTVRCRDRTGDYTYRYCDMRVSFTSTPANGSCGERLTGQTGSPTNMTCTTTCSPPGNITACPPPTA